MDKVYIDKLKSLSGTSFAVAKVHPPYFFGWNPSFEWEKTNRDGSVEKKRGKFFTYVKFPLDARMVIESGDREIAERKGEPATELRLKEWDNGVNKFVFRKLERQPDYKTGTGVFEKDAEGKEKEITFFRLYKKVFDIEVQFQATTKLKTRGKLEDGTYGQVEVEGDEFEVKAVSASHIRTMLKMFTKATKEIQKVPRKDKMGNPTMDLPFDWEDKVKDKLVGICASLDVEGSGLRTEYNFSVTDRFELRKPTTDNSFETFGEPEKKEKKSSLQVDESELANVPF